MSEFVCPECEERHDYTGKCEKCGAALQKACPMCGKAKDKCYCHYDKNQQPEQRKH